MNKLMKYQASKNDQMQPCHNGGKSLIVVGKAPKMCHSGKRTFHHSALWLQDKTALRLGKFHDFQAKAIGLGSFSCCIASIALIDRRPFDRLTSDLLHALSQRAHLRPVLLVGRRHKQGQQMSQRIDSHIDLAALVALSPIKTRMAATFGRRLQNLAIENSCAGITFAAFDSAQQQSQVIDHRFETSHRQPPLGLLTDDVLGRQITQHHAPRGTDTHHLAQAIVHFSRLVMPLFAIFWQQNQIESHEGPFVVAHVAWIGIPRTHPTIFIMVSRSNAEQVLEALQHQLDTVKRKYEISACLLVEGEVVLPEYLEGGLYDIIEEVLNNIVKHAQATGVTVRLQTVFKEIEVEVTNNREGFPLNPQLREKD